MLLQGARHRNPGRPAASTAQNASWCRLRITRCQNSTGMSRMLSADTITRRAPAIKRPEEFPHRDVESERRILQHGSEVRRSAGTFRCKRGNCCAPCECDSGAFWLAGRSGREDEVGGMCGIRCDRAVRRRLTRDASRSASRSTMRACCAGNLPQRAVREQQGRAERPAACSAAGLLGNPDRAAGRLRRP